MNRLTKIIVFIVSVLLGFLLFSGCSDAGFDKRTTLMPDRVGISLSQQRFKSEDAAWRGISFNAQWNLK